MSEAIIYYAPKEVIDFFNAMATKVGNENDDDGIFYYMPYWFKKGIDNRFQMIRFEELPKWVTDLIEANRSY